MQSKGIIWTGRIISALLTMLFLSNGVTAVVKPAVIVEGLAHLGYPSGLANGITITQLVCAVLYAIPQTSVLGAILLTGYLGGATASHLRAGEAIFFPVVIGVLVWVGLWLRDERLRALVPFRRPA